MALSWLLFVCLLFYDWHEVFRWVSGITTCKLCVVRRCWSQVVAEVDTVATAAVVVAVLVDVGVFLVFLCVLVPVLVFAFVFVPVLVLVIVLVLVGLVVAFALDKLLHKAVSMAAA